MADFRLPISDISTHKSVSPKSFIFKKDKDNTLSYDGSKDVTFTVSVQDGSLTGPVLQFQTTDGTNTVSANIDIPDASTTKSGVVTTTTQSFAGNKTFTGNVTINGVISTKSSAYTDDGKTGAINLNNSNIIGLNGIYMYDESGNAQEGINFYRTATTADTIWAKGGVLYFTPNRTYGTNGTSYTVLHTNNISPSWSTWSNSNDGTGPSVTLTVGTKTATLQIPDATTTSEGVVTLKAQTFVGEKTFKDGIHSTLYCVEDSSNNHKVQLVYNETTAALNFNFV